MDPFESIRKDLKDLNDSIKEYDAKIETEKSKPKHEQDLNDIHRWEQNILTWRESIKGLEAEKAALTAEKAALTRKLEAEAELVEMQVAQQRLQGLSLSNGGLLASFPVSFHWPFTTFCFCRCLKEGCKYQEG
jgi:DNA repair exonuclease SbcCD ATPase subunit